MNLRIRHVAGLSSLHQVPDGLRERTHPAHELQCPACVRLVIEEGVAVSERVPELLQLLRPGLVPLPGREPQPPTEARNLAHEAQALVQHEGVDGAGLEVPASQLLVPLQHLSAAILGEVRQEPPLPLVACDQFVQAELGGQDDREHRHPHRDPPEVG